MKKIYLCLLTLTLLSCSEDSLFSLTKNDAVLPSFSPMEKDAFDLASNSSNPYDSAGAVYTELFDAYYDVTNLPQSISEIDSLLQVISSSNPRFITLKTDDYSSISLSKISAIVQQPATCVTYVLSTISLSEMAKQRLQTFINSLLSLYETEENSETLYDFIVDYEEQVLKSNLLTAFDKKVLLTTTSITRYSIVRNKKKPKKNTDPDWDLMVGNIIGGTLGSAEGSAEGVFAALLCGIAQNATPLYNN